LGVDTDSILRCAARSVRLSLKLGDIYRPPPPRPTRIADHRKPTGSALDIEAEFQRHWSQLIERQEVQAVTRLLKSARTRLSKREQKISGDLARCAEADSLLKKGELLKGQLYKVGVKAEQVVLDDWYEEGTPTLVLTLDPRLDGPGNIEMLFKRYRKARDGAVRAETRMSEARSQRVELDALAAQDLDADSLRVSLSRMGLIGRQQSHGATTAITRKPYHEFVSCRGERILVGRGGADNHQTTFHVAKGNDHWLHTRDSPGAHVIVPCPNRGQSPHPETIKDAAALAIHHSRLRGEPGVAVSQTFRKHLRPIKGGAPGQVTVASAKTVFCDDMVVRIQRLYIEKRAQ
jgi:predicted ribosome quality control (RQC) complex YloA/Tae2 family protein